MTTEIDAKEPTGAVPKLPVNPDPRDPEFRAQLFRSGGTFTHPNRTENVVTIEPGFSILVFFLGPLGLLLLGLWRQALLLVAVHIGYLFFIATIGEVLVKYAVGALLVVFAPMAIHIWFAKKASVWRMEELLRRGYKVTAIVTHSAPPSSWDPAALFELAFRGDYVTLAAESAAALSRFPKNAHALYWQAFLADREGGPGAATNRYDAVPIDTFFLIADAWAKRGRTDEATHTLAALVRLHPGEEARATKALRRLGRVIPTTTG